MSHEARVSAARRLLASVEKNHSSAVLESCFGAEDMVILDLIARDGLAIGVATIDTGRLPRQTHDLIEDIRRQYGLEIRVVSPWPDTVSAHVAQYGADGFYEGREQRAACCTVRREERRRHLGGALQLRHRLSPGAAHRLAFEQHDDCAEQAGEQDEQHERGPRQRARASGMR